MEKELRDYIKKLSEKDKKTITQKALKCAEETGELARKVLPYENAHGTTHRFITNNSILEEVADVVLTAMSIGYDLGYSHDEIDDMIRTKALNWQAVQAKSDRVTDSIPFEMHITISAGEGFDVEKYVSDCNKISKIRGNKIKPIVIDLENEGQSIMKDVMTSSHYFGTNAGAYMEAKAIEQSMLAMDYNVVRVKVETVPFHPAAPQTKEDKMPGDCYFEAHIGCIITPEEKDLLAELAKRNGAHMSRNFFKKIEDGKFVNMITYRSYDGTFPEFEKKVNLIQEDLRENEIYFEKVITEFAIYDTKVSHDFLWLEKTNTRSMSKFKIKRRFPNYMTGFEETEHFVDTVEELEKINWIDNWKSETPGFYKFAISKSEISEHHHLMALLNDDEKFGGCKSWWVIGYIIGNDVDELGLEEYDKLIGDHLDGCPQKTWQHNECTCGFKN